MADFPQTLNLPPPTKQRHSAPSLLRGRWRRIRRSSPISQDTLQSPAKVKGPTGLNLLHEPSEPRVDFIFIHGLQGDSRKTWCHNSEDPASYWPREWLPYEASFRHVRIHSFGYESEWTRGGKSALTIHDFAQALLMDMSDSPSLQRNGETPIVFVAHSMGGLIAKKAYLLGGRNPYFQPVVNRIHSFYFLGTPHRGSNSAIFLDYYLRLSLTTGPKEFVRELLPDSPSVQAINDEFRHVNSKVKLWSFYEAQTTNGQFIVPKSSAVIGLPGEQSRYLQADHRHLCKFDSPTNANFIILHRCFRSTIEDIERDYALRQIENHKAQMKLIAEYFDVPERPTKDLLTEVHKRHGGSCEWITSHDHFHEWLDCEVQDAADIGPLDPSPTTKSPRLFWLNGLPGSGKSVAAGHVISHLEAHNEDCSFFFFKNNSKATVTHLLRALAFQMAWTNFEIRRMFVSMIENDDVANAQDHTVIWNNIFLGRIFKVKFSKPQFWIIDALDECPTKSLTAFIQMFAKLGSSTPLRVFATSRPNTHLDRLLAQERIKYVELSTGRDGSLGDIAAYVRSRPRLLEADADGEIVSEIVKKSNGVFLWASLIIDRLDDLYSVEDMREELRRNPPEMNSLYTRIIQEIDQSPSAGLAKCIVKWVVCAPEPLTTDVIKEAIKMDIGRTLLPSESDKVFSQICKNLIAVDDESRVQVMHQTVKEFVSSAESGFYINLCGAHESIATICLRHLNQRKFDARAATRALVSTNSPGVSFDNHVDINFAYHLSHSHSLSPELFLLLIKFLDSTVLTWVERVAMRQKLSPFISTIQYLKPYLSRQLEWSPPLDKNYRKTVDWVDDLTRLVTIFGPYLIDMPSSIRTLIPPLCPTSSMLHQTFARRCRPRITCSSNEKWDERLSCLVLSSLARSIAANSQYLAVGLVNGTIRVFSSSTLEAVTTLALGNSRLSVQRMMFGNISNLLVSTGPRLLTLWRLPSEKVWSVPLKREVKSVCFNTDDSKLYVTMKEHVNEAIITFAVEDGHRIKPLPIVEDSSDSDEAPVDWTGSHKRYVPTLIRISPVLSFAAVSYRSSHLTIFSLDEDDNMEKFCRFKKSGYEELQLPPQVLDVAFNPAVESNLMAISYQDGDIITAEIDGWNAEEKSVYHLYATVLASSPDGRTLAAGDNEGGVCLFTFDTLRLLHRIELVDEIVTAIIFSSNSLRFYDIRRSTCNIWEPAALVRKKSVDDSSSDPDELVVASVTSPDILRTRPLDNTRTITVMTHADDGHFVFCGREDGCVTVHDASNGKKVYELALHSADVRHLAWHSREKVLFSIDTSGRCMATRLSTNPWTKLGQILSHSASAEVTQILIKQDGLAILLVTHNGEELWESGMVTTSNHSYDGNYYWVCHPTNTDRLLLFRDDKIHLYKWKGLERESSESGIALVLPPEMNPRLVPTNWYSHPGIKAMIQAVSSFETSFLKLDASDLGPTKKTASLSGATKKLLAGVRVILGTHKSKIFFLSTRGWVCSISLDVSSDTKYYIRHFFIPPLWRTGGEPMIQMIPGKTPRVAIAYRDDLVLFHRFLDMENRVSFEGIK